MANQDRDRGGHDNLGKRIAAAYVPGNEEKINRTFEEVYDQTRRLVRAIGRRINPNQEDVEDNEVATYTNFHRSLQNGKYKPEKANVSSYIARTAKNAAIDHNRKLMRTPTKSLREDLPDTRSNTDQSDTRIDVQAAIAKLSPDEKAFVKARYYDDHTLQEIADRTDTPIGSVKSKDHRLKAKLRNLLK